MIDFVLRFQRYHRVGFSISRSLHYAWLVSTTTHHAGRFIPH